MALRIGDHLYGGDGNDNLFDTFSDDAIPSDDILFGEAGDDYLYSGTGTQ